MTLKSKHWWPPWQISILMRQLKPHLSQLHQQPAPAATADNAAAAKEEEPPKDTGKTEEAAMEGLSSLFG